MTTYSDVFGSDTIAPSEYTYSSISISTDTSVYWATESSGGVLVANINDVDCTVTCSITLPDVTSVSVGKDLLIRNTGSAILTLLDNGGSTVTTVDAGRAKYLYVTDNSTPSGTWGSLVYGAGSSSVSAGELVGYGIKAISGSLNQKCDLVSESSSFTVSDTNRSKLVVYTGGSGTATLTSSGIIGADFFFFLRNEGTGSLTIEPNGTELIDGIGSFIVQPGESSMIVCDGTNWHTVGYSRFTTYQFSQLTKDVTSGSPFTLSAVESSNKLLTFVGTPVASVTVKVPEVVSIYYVHNNCSTSQTVTLITTGIGSTGININQGERAIVFSDGTDIVSAMSTTVSSSINLINGSATTPSLSFASKTNSGLYLSGTQDVAVTVNGVTAMTVTDTGVSFAHPEQVLSNLGGPFESIGSSVAMSIALG